MRKSLARVALAAFAGASVWISLGHLAVLDAAGSRVASFPPLWLLAALVIAAVGIALARPTGVPGDVWPLAISALLWLPYLPFAIPAAFLIWEGPIEGLVWMAVISGLVFAQRPRWLARAGLWASAPRRAPWMAAVLAAACYTFGAIRIGHLLPGGDEPHYLVITQSLLLDGDLLIENNHERGDYRVYKDQPLKPDFIQRGQDGQIYPMHAPGVAALVLPAFAAAGYPGAVATVIAITAAASALAWHAAWLLTASASGAWLGWAAVFLTTPYFFHGFTIYPDGTGGLFTIAGVWLLVSMEMRKRAGLPTLILVGAALAALPWLHARFALIAAALGLAIALRLRREPEPFKRIGIFLTIPAVAAAGWFAYFWIIWGTPNPSAPQGRDLMMTTDQIWRGGAGLLFDQQFGLLTHAPIYAVALLGLAPLGRRHPRLTVELLAASLPYVIATSSFAAWWGGVSAPARYLAALIPMAALPLALWWRERSSPAWRALALLALLPGLAMVLPKLLVEYGALIYNDRAGVDLFLDWVARSVDLPIAAPSLHRGSLWSALADGGVWFAAGGAMALAAMVLAWRRVHDRGAIWALTAGWCAAAMMAACAAVWIHHGVRGTRPVASHLSFLREWDPFSNQTDLQVSPPRRIRPAELARRLEVANVSRAAVDPSDPTVLVASRLPAAEYDVVIDSAGASHGEVSVRVGRTDHSIERWPLDGPSRGMTLSLPVPVHSVTLQADQPGRASISGVRLRVKAMRETALADGRFALRANRYGRTRAFFLDDSAYMEAAGFWTRGEETTAVAFDSEGDDVTRPLALVLQSGPVPTTVDLSMGEWQDRLTFNAGEQRTVLVPAAHGPGRIVAIRTGAWFRPHDYDSTSADTRRLGVFVTMPQ